MNYRTESLRIRSLIVSKTSRDQWEFFTRGENVPFGLLLLRIPQANQIMSSCWTETISRLAGTQTEPLLPSHMKTELLPPGTCLLTGEHVP